MYTGDLSSRIDGGTGFSDRETTSENCQALFTLLPASVNAFRHMALMQIFWRNFWKSSLVEINSVWSKWYWFPYLQMTKSYQKTHYTDTILLQTVFNEDYVLLLPRELTPVSTRLAWKPIRSALNESRYWPARINRSKESWLMYTCTVMYWEPRSFWISVNVKSKCIQSQNAIHAKWQNEISNYKTGWEREMIDFEYRSCVGVIAIWLDRTVGNGIWTNLWLVKGLFLKATL